MGPLADRRVFITGAARGIGAALAQRLHRAGAKVALAGLEPELLSEVAASCDNAFWASCDVTDPEQVEAAVQAAVDRLGGLDVVVANAGVAAQLPLIGGDRAVFERIMKVNAFGAYYTVRAAGPHISHPNGYALVVASLAAAVHIPLLGAYSASKAAVEALGNTLRTELHPSGARAGVAYFAELDTDMTTRGFGTKAARELVKRSRLHRVSKLEVGIDALEKGIARRARRVVAPRRVGLLLPLRMALQPLIDSRFRHGLAEVLEIARGENASLTTPQPGQAGSSSATSQPQSQPPSATAHG